MSNTKQTRRVTPVSSDTLLPLLETLPGALLVVDEAATIVYANASTQAILGATREDVLGKPLWRGAPQLVSTALYQAVQRTRQTRTPAEVEYVSPVTGTWLHVQLSPTVGGLMVQVHQGRAAARQEAPVPQGERLCIEDLDGLLSRIGVLTPEGIVLEINEVPLAEARVRREEVIGRPLAEARWWSSSPTSQAQLRATIARASRGETVRFEAVIHPRAGMDRHLDVAVTPRRDGDHHIAYLVIAGIDITERKRTEQQLKESEQDLRVLAETVPQMVWVTRPDGLHDYTNQRWQDYTGFTLEHMQNDPWAQLQFIHPADQEGTRAYRQHALDTGTMYEHEERIRNGQNGEYRWFLTRAMPMRDEGGHIVKWFGTCTDIEEQKRTEEALRQSQERANALMNANIIGINVIEGEQIVDANDTFLRMTGYTRKDLLAGRMNVLQMTPPEYRARTLQAHQELATWQVMTPYEKEYICQDGSCFPALVCGVVLQHHPFQMIGFVLDNSARKELEQRKDDFISMASHELKTPLTAVKIQTQLARKRLAKHSQHEAATELSRVESPIKQLERLIAELLDVSKIRAGRLEYIRERVDLDELLQEVTNTMQHTSSSHTIVVRGSVQDSLIGDRDRLRQVFTNLLSNAIKYSPDAQTVEIDLSASEDAVTIRMHDHGLGIAQEQRDKIFERFYRAASLRQSAIPGLGMGLYIVAEIVKHHGGTITVDSAVGKGSTFTVTLPLVREA